MCQHVHVLDAVALVVRENGAAADGRHGREEALDGGEQRVQVLDLVAAAIAAIIIARPGLLVMQVLGARGAAERVGHERQPRGTRDGVDHLPADGLEHEAVELVGDGLGVAAVTQRRMQIGERHDLMAVSHTLHPVEATVLAAANERHDRVRASRHHEREHERASKREVCR